MSRDIGFFAPEAAMRAAADLKLSRIISGTRSDRCPQMIEHPFQEHCFQSASLRNGRVDLRIRNLKRRLRQIHVNGGDRKDV